MFCIPKYQKIKEMLEEYVASYAASMFVLEDLTSEIDRCISDNRVDDRASSELARIRKRIAVVEDRIASKLNSILNSPTWQGKLQDQVVSIRNGSYVIPVKREYRRSIEGTVVDTSSSGSTVFIEPSAIRALKNELNLLRIDPPLLKPKFMRPYFAILNQSLIFLYMTDRMTKEVNILCKYTKSELDY